MNIFHDADGLAVYNADVLDALPMLHAGSIDAVVTSPPYAMQCASTYGGVPEADYPDWTVAWMDALKPALAERGSVMLNISPHVKGGMLADYVLRMRLALRADGWFEHDELIWLKSSTMPHGRPEVPVRAWESVFWYSRTPRPWSDARRNGSPIQYGKGKTATDGTAFTTGRGNRLDWGHLKVGGGTVGSHTRSRCKNYVEMGNTAGVPAGAARKLWDHPAPFPPKFADWLMKINTPDGGVVLDPFAGSGTTAVAALRNGFQSVAIEREPEYAQMIVDRYSAELAKQEEGLFDAA